MARCLMLHAPDQCFGDPVASSPIYMNRSPVGTKGVHGLLDHLTSFPFPAGAFLLLNLSGLQYGAGGNYAIMLVPPQRHQ